LNKKYENKYDINNIDPYSIRLHSASPRAQKEAAGWVWGVSIS